MTAVVLAVLVSSCVTGPGASPRSACLPAGAFDGLTKLSLRRSGSELTVHVPETLSWEPAVPPPGPGEADDLPPDPQSAVETLSSEYTLVPGITLRLWKQGPAESPTAGWVEVEGDGFAGDTELEIELFPDRFEGPPVWGRLGARRLPDIVFLARGRSGGRLQNTVVDTRTGWALQLDGSGDAVSWFPLENAPGRGASAGGFRVRFRPSTPPGSGQETRVRLRWRYHPPSTVSIPPRTSGGGLPRAETSGWVVHPDSVDFDETSILELAWNLLRFTPSDSLSAFEFGRGWRDGVEKGTTRPPDDPVTGRPGRAAFPDGLAPVVSTLSVQGFRVGLWIAPFGSDDREELKDRPERFISGVSDGEPIDVRLADGPPSAFASHVFDPTSEAGRRAIRERVESTLREHGEAVRILRIGGLGELASCYERCAPLLNRSGGGGGRNRVASRSERRQVAREAFYAALTAVRAAAGEGRILAGDASTPDWAAGLLDACRPRLEPRDGGDLLRLQAAAALRDLRHHGLAWQGEGLRFDLDEADRAGWLDSPAARRAFLDLQSLTGRSARLEPASFLRFAARTEPEYRDEIETLRVALRRSSPTGVRRALDLDGPGRIDTSDLPAIWCVTGRDADGGVRDVLGVFNWNSFAPERVEISLERLGWRAAERRRVLVFDLEAERVLGIVTRGEFDLLLPPRSSRLLTLLEFPGRPTVIADSLWKVSGERRGVEESWDDASGVLDITRRASVRPPPGGRERIHLIAPGPHWSVVDAQVPGGASRMESSGIHHILELGMTNGPRSPLHARVTFHAGAEPSAAGREAGPGVVSAVAHPGSGGVWIEWEGVSPDRPGAVRVYEVRVDGVAVGRTFDCRFLHLPEPPWSPDTSHSVAVVTVEEPSGTRRAGSETAYREPAAADMALAELCPVLIEQPWGFPGKNRAADGSPLEADLLATVSTRGGIARGVGLGVSIPSRIEYDLRGRFVRFTARAGIDRDADLWSGARFRVELDGKEIYASPFRRFGDRPVAIDLAVVGGRRLVLEVERPEGKAERPVRSPLAFWRDARLEARGGEKVRR